MKYKISKASNLIRYFAMTSRFRSKRIIWLLLIEMIVYVKQNISIPASRCYLYSTIFECILICRMKFSNFLFFFRFPLERRIFLPGDILVFDCLKNKYQHSMFCCVKGETSMSSKAVHKMLGNYKQRLSTFCVTSSYQSVRIFFLIKK